MIQDKININKKLKIAIDCGNAAGCLVAPSLYKKFNIDLHELYCDIDGTFPNHHPDPTVDSNLVDLFSLNVLKAHLLRLELCPRCLKPQKGFWVFLYLVFKCALKINCLE